LRVNFSCLAELLTCSFEHGIVDLAVIFNDVDGFSITISEGRDLLGSLGPAHCVGVVLEGLDEDDSLVGDHVESVTAKIGFSVDPDLHEKSLRRIGSRWCKNHEESDLYVCVSVHFLFCFPFRIKLLSVPKAVSDITW
jgi:hypothetical protein